MVFFITIIAAAEKDNKSEVNIEFKITFVLIASFLSSVSLFFPQELLAGIEHFENYGVRNSKFKQIHRIIWVNARKQLVWLYFNDVTLKKWSVTVCCGNFQSYKMGNWVFFTASSYLSVCAFEFRSIDSGSRKLIGQNSWLCLSWVVIGWARWKKVRHFLHMKTIPFFMTKQTAVFGVFAKNLKWCLPREGQGFAQNITEKLKRFLQIHEAAVWVRAFVFREIGFQQRQCLL